MIKIKQFECNFYSENCYILSDETKEAVIIDCGALKEEEQSIKKYIDDNELKLKHLLCTHLHLDHIFGNAFIKETYKLTPKAHKADVENLPSLKAQAESMGLQGIIDNVEIDKNYLKEGDTISFGQTTLQVFETPGHSPGHVVFYEKNEKKLFGGDCLFKMSIGRTDLWGGDLKTLLNSIHNKILSLPDETTVYPGHGPNTTVGFERKNNYYLNM